jgi:hypothetical protein
MTTTTSTAAASHSRTQSVEEEAAAYYYSTMMMMDTTTTPRSSRTASQASSRPSVDELMTMTTARLLDGVLGDMVAVSTPRTAAGGEGGVWQTVRRVESYPQDDLNLWWSVDAGYLLLDEDVKEKKAAVVVVAVSAEEEDKEEVEVSRRLLLGAPPLLLAPSSPAVTIGVEEEEQEAMMMTVDAGGAGGAEEAVAPAAAAKRILAIVVLIAIAFYRSHLAITRYTTRVGDVHCSVCKLRSHNEGSNLHHPGLSEDFSKCLHMFRSYLHVITTVIHREKSWVLHHIPQIVHPVTVFRKTSNLVSDLTRCFFRCVTVIVACVEIKAL